MKKNILETIEKLAKGYSVEEITEEYGVEDGELKLLKRKEVKKEIPSDLKAIKMLAETEDFSSMSDAELEQEKRRLIAELKETEECGTKRSEEDI